MKKIIISLILVLVFVIGCGSNKLEDQIVEDLGEKLQEQVRDEKIDVCKLLSIEEVKEKCNVIEKDGRTLKAKDFAGGCSYSYGPHDGSFATYQLLMLDYSNDLEVFDSKKVREGIEPVNGIGDEAIYLDNVFIGIYFREGKKSASVGAYVVSDDPKSNKLEQHCSIAGLKELAKMVAKRID